MLGLVLLRATHPNTVFEPFSALFLSTSAGRFFDYWFWTPASYLVNSLLQQAPSFLELLRTMGSAAERLTSEILTSEMPRVAAGLLGGGASALIGLVVAWWYYAPVRRSCSAHIFVTTLKMVKTIDDIVEQVEFDGVKGPEMELRDSPSQATLRVTPEIRMSFRRLNVQLDVLRDLLTAYDYSFNRFVRTVAVVPRNYSASVKEAIEALCVEIEQTQTTSIDILAERNMAHLVVDGEIKPVPIHIAIHWVLDLHVQLAARIEENNRYISLPASGRVLTGELKGLREEARELLRQVRIRLRKGRGKRLEYLASNFPMQMNIQADRQLSTPIIHGAS